MPFSSLPALLADAIAARGYTAPSPVQTAVLAPEAAGRDLIVSAQTGSGKTVAFGIAMADELLPDGQPAPYAITPRALVIAPTRELALQVSRELEWLYAAARVRIVTCVGGMDAMRERRNLASGAHIVVGTPGRLRDHLERGALDLGTIAVAVLDEADEMLDMGFREELEAILDATPPARRTLMFSATIPKPILALAKAYQQDALRISAVGDDRGHGDIRYQAVTVAPADVEHAVVNLLRLHDAETAMLFCATRDNVRRLHASLIERGFQAVALSGEHSQNERNQALQALRDQRARVCVATDVAARGIDLPALSLVIHVDLPRDGEALQHRSGRTGRAGKKGTAILMVPYPRRRRVEAMLRAARIEAEWKNPPTAAEVRAEDRERLFATITQPAAEVAVDDDDRTLAVRVQNALSADAIALALVRAHRAKMPVAEEYLDAGSADPAERRPAVKREGFEDTVWFKMDIGRRQNADVRWILPLLCRRGHVTKNEVGAIKIGQHETMFDVPRHAADRFAAAVARTAAAEAANEAGGDGVTITRMDQSPRDAARMAGKGTAHAASRDNAARPPRPPHRVPHPRPQSARTQPPTRHDRPADAGKPQGDGTPRLSANRAGPDKAPGKFANRSPDAKPFARTHAPGNRGAPPRSGGSRRPGPAPKGRTDR